MTTDNWSFNHFITDCLNMDVECQLCELNHGINYNKQVYSAYNSNYCIVSIIGNILQLLNIINEDNE